MYQSTGIKCPCCGGDIMESDRAFGCRNWKDVDGGCKATIWKTSYGHEVTLEEARELFEGNDIGPFDLTFKSGNSAHAGLYFDADEKKVRVRFPKRDNAD